MNKITIGQSDFKNLRKAQAYYVDKSLFIEEFINSPHQTALLPRPRRFGKTLNLSLLKYFFEKKEEDESLLFDGLAIKDSPLFKEHFAKYPVIFMTFKDIKHSSWKNCLNDIKINISEEYENHKYLLDSDCMSATQLKDFNDILSRDADEATYCNSLKMLSKHLKKYHNKGVIILIDEYDTPIHAGYQYGYYKDEIIPFMLNFLSGGYKDNSNLARGAITGTLRVSKESIFTGLNNLGVYTLLENEFNNCFGFTKDEVKKILCDFNLTDYYDEIIKWYDGYIFGDNTILNPWSVMSFISKQKIRFKPYWLNTASMEMIEEIVLGKPEEEKQVLKYELMDLIQDGCIEKTIYDDIVLKDLEKTNNDLVWSFLLHSGYLKAVELIDDEFEDIYKLQIPNMEVKIAYRKLVQKWFSETVNLEDLKIMLNALSNGNISLFEKYLKSISMVIMSYHDFSGSPEKVYHALSRIPYQNV